MNFPTIILLNLMIVTSSRAQSSNCTCVPFFQCSVEDYQVISDGRGLLEVRKSRQCEGVFEICCNNTLTTTSTAAPTTPPTRCGVHNPDRFSWSAALLFKQYPNFVSSYKCRVSLIHPKVAITAAHCLEDKGYYQVRIGSTVRPVAHMVVHPAFKEATLQNDVALLLLSKSFKLDKIGTVCVPPPGSTLDGTNCTTVTQASNENLKVIHLPIVSKDACVESLRESRLGRFFQLHESFVCAGGDGQEDTCGGDGGSPLICPVPGVPGRYQQVGIVSWGIGCGGGVPGVYVNLAHFRNWIDDVMVKNGLDVDAYRL